MTGNVGRCGSGATLLGGGQDVCALDAGHKGWHRGDTGVEWGRVDGPTVRYQENELARLRARVQELEGVLDEILRPGSPWESGYPGRPAVRTHWVSIETYERWVTVLLDADGGV